MSCRIETGSRVPRLSLSTIAHVSSNGETVGLTTKNRTWKSDMTVMNFVLSEALKVQIESNVAKLERRDVEDPQLRHAAVAIVITEDPQRGCASILLTLRPKTIKRHANQYALPGGRLEEGETPEQAALRELSEELGVDLNANQIIGRLDDFGTHSGFRITPIVVWGGPSLEINPDPNEVAIVHHIPLDDLNSPDIPILTPLEGSEHPILSAHIETLGHEVWAPTAAMLYQFREIALRGEMTRVHFYEQPAFARK
jgi:8-oxo-dGTP pyrophosphatase MutT (NUDIX family)